MDAVELARRYGLGRAARLSDRPVARGKQGLVWRLDTADGRWAVKVPFRVSGEDGAAAATSFQEVAYAAGVPAPLGHITEIAATDWLTPNPAPPSGPAPKHGSTRPSTNRTPASCSRPF